MKKGSQLACIAFLPSFPVYVVTSARRSVRRDTSQMTFSGAIEDIKIHYIVHSSEAESIL